VLVRKIEDSVPGEICRGVDKEANEPYRKFKHGVVWCDGAANEEDAGAAGEAMK
jgi:hypothetical protein